MKNVLLFAASNNPESINGKLISYTADLFKKHKTNVLRLYDYPPTSSGIQIKEKKFSDNLKKSVDQSEK